MKELGIRYKAIPKTVFPRHTPSFPRPRPAPFVIPAQAGIQRTPFPPRGGAYRGKKSMAGCLAARRAALLHSAVPQQRFRSARSLARQLFSNA